MLIDHHLRKLKVGPRLSLAFGFLIMLLLVSGAIGL